MCFFLGSRDPEDLLSQQLSGVPHSGPSPDIPVLYLTTGSARLLTTSTQIPPLPPPPPVTANLIGVFCEVGWFACLQIPHIRECIWYLSFPV